MNDLNLNSFFFLVQLDINLITPGIYRQRSYDNLKNGESKFSIPSMHHRLPRSTHLALPLSNNTDTTMYHFPHVKNQNGQQKEQQLAFDTQIDDLHDANTINYNDPVYDHETTDDINLDLGQSSHALSPPPSALLVPIHYKYHTPQRRYRDLAIRYQYHKNRSVPRKLLLEQEKYRRESERHGIRSSKANDIRVCVDLQSPTDPMQSLLREIDLCDASENEKDPMLRLNRSYYREYKKRFSLGHDAFSRKASRFSNIYDYSLASIFEGFTSDDSL